MLTATKTVAWAGRFLGDFLVCNGLDKAAEKKILASKVPWHAPCHDQIKINVDIAIDSSLEYIGIGVVVESDALNTISAIQNPVAGAPKSNVVEDIRDSLFPTRVARCLGPVVKADFAI
ncbi:hypothetical protein TIFTF001_016826 [Ficus carica]|uniref:Uncharacterized protein n=1 Tax=Ficus carica TaxID=3494 RepID=A0AA88AK66_FICCA|nr:hypothetical protein TIFTF001_016826 [Ficus carica]